MKAVGRQLPSLIGKLDGPGVRQFHPEEGRSELLESDTPGNLSSGAQVSREYGLGSKRTAQGPRLPSSGLLDKSGQIGTDRRDRNCKRIVTRQIPAASNLVAAKTATRPFDISALPPQGYPAFGKVNVFAMTIQHCGNLLASSWELRS